MGLVAPPSRLFAEVVRRTSSPNVADEESQRLLAAAMSGLRRALEKRFTETDEEARTHMFDLYERLEAAEKESANTRARLGLTTILELSPYRGDVARILAEPVAGEEERKTKGGILLPPSVTI